MFERSREHTSKYYTLCSLDKTHYYSIIILWQGGSSRKERQNRMSNINLYPSKIKDIERLQSYEYILNAMLQNEGLIGEYDREFEGARTK